MVGDEVEQREHDAADEDLGAGRPTLQSVIELRSPISTVTSPAHVVPLAA